MNDNLTAPELERLALLLEECGEVTQMIGKIHRWGFESVWTKDGDSNRTRLQSELGDLLSAIHRMADANDISMTAVDAAKLSKDESAKPWLKHQN